MSSDELTETLEDAGLSPYQADAFVTLLELGSASATDIAQASSVPDPRIYDVLRGLEEQGYVETYDRDSLHVRAHDPAAILADLRSRADRYETAAEEIADRWSRPDVEEHKVSIVKRLDTVLARADELIREAGNQVQIGLTPAQFDELSDALTAARENGADEANYVRRRGVPGRGSWFTRRAVSGGGALVDLGVHAIDLAMYLLGYPEAESVSGVTRSEFGSREEYPYLEMWGEDDESRSFDYSNERASASSPAKRTGRSSGRASPGGTAARTTSRTAKPSCDSNF